MRLYNVELLELLQPEFGKEPIHYVGLGAHDFQFAFGNLNVRNMLRVDFYLQGMEYTWESGPCAIPVWLLIDQVPSELTLKSSTALRVIFVTGDWLTLHTEEGPYESQIFEWPATEEGAGVMEVL